ncbi:MAG: hypothetical protein IKR19_07590 [Acholeplasmatales bacterium]|nr:hypothetical protein [Acholeplasmatales bacterium]
MYTKHTYLTRKQLSLQKITKAVIFDKNYQKPALIYEEDERDYRESYQYDFNNPGVADRILGINEKIVDTIMDLIRLGYDNITISKELDLPVTTVYEVQSGNIYREKTVKAKLMFSNLYSPDLPLRDDQIETIIKLALDNYNYYEIHNITSIDIDRVKEVVKGMNYKNTLDLPGPNKKLPPRILRRMDMDPPSNYNKTFRNITTLSDKEVLWIADRLVEGYGLKEISRMYGIDKEAVRSIRRKTTHKELLKDYEFPATISNAVLAMPDYKVHGICLELQSGNRDYKEIANKFGVPKQSVYLIKKRRRFVDISKNYKWED